MSEGAGGPPPRKSLNDRNPYAGAGVSATYSSSVGAHISTRGLLEGDEIYATKLKGLSE